LRARVGRSGLSAALAASNRILVMTRTTSTICAALLLAASAGPVFAQSAETPAPAQAGEDPSMARPQGSTQPALQAPQPVQNPESTVGLAPADQPINNAKPRVAGEIVPSSQETAAHNPSIFEHDQQPTLTHTFNFTAEQKQAIVAALAQDNSGSAQQNPGQGDLKETMVVPESFNLKPVPDQIGQAMPWVKPYYYVKSGNRIALVNPLGRYVVSVIE
jgi:hypothetical protein